MELEVTNGGYLVINNYDNGLSDGRTDTDYYDGSTRSHTASITFDFVRPVHCAVESGCADDMLDVGVPYRSSVSVWVWLIRCSCFWAISYLCFTYNMLMMGDPSVYYRSCVCVCTWFILFGELIFIYFVFCCYRWIRWGSGKGWLWMTFRKYFYLMYWRLVCKYIEYFPQSP